MATSPAREDEHGQRPADEAADVAADRDVVEREAKSEVDQHDEQRGTAEDVDAVALEHEARAENPEDRSGRADRRACRRHEERSSRAGEDGEEVHGEKAAAAEQVLERPPEPPEHEHVEEDVKRVRVQEGGCDEPPPVTVGHFVSAQIALLEDLPVWVREAARFGALDEVNEHVDRDQSLGDDETGAFACDAADTGRRLLGAGRPSGALRALDPDRAEDHAVRADGPPAVRAAHRRLRPRMAIADLGLRLLGARHRSHRNEGM